MSRIQNLLNKLKPRDPKENCCCLSEAAGLADTSDDTDCSTPYADELFCSNLVYSLNSKNYENFLSKLDITLVMFYKSQDRQTMSSIKNLDSAAKMTHREFHAYAAVDCGKNRAFCRNQDVDQTPMFKLYNKNKLLGTIRDPKGTSCMLMMDLVEKTPINIPNSCGL